MYVVPVFFLGCFVVSCNAGLAPFITPCKAGDNACMLTSAQAALPYLAAGLPDLGVPSADPLVFDDLRADEGDLKLQFRNVHVIGTSRCTILSPYLSADKSQLEFALECPIRATGQYSVDGKFMFLTIEGEGDFEIRTEKIKLLIKAQCNIIDGADGKSHWNIVSFEHEYEPEEQVYFRFDNLFGGNQEKAGAILDILNRSGKEVTKSLGKPIIAEIVHKAKDYINLFFHAVPADEMFLA